MKTTIKIKNFRSLEDVEIELAPTTVLVGPNGAGKSSLLKLLKFVGINLLQSQVDNWPKIKYKSNEINLGDFNSLVTGNDTAKEILFDLKIHTELNQNSPHLLNDHWILDVDGVKKHLLECYPSLTDTKLINLFLKIFGESSERIKYYSSRRGSMDLSLRFCLTKSSKKNNLKYFELSEDNFGDLLFFRYSKSKESPINRDIGCRFANENVTSLFNELIAKMGWSLESGLSKKDFIVDLYEIISKFYLQKGLGDKMKRHIIEEFLVPVLGFYFIVPKILRRTFEIHHLPSTRENEIKLPLKPKDKFPKDSYLHYFYELPDSEADVEKFIDVYIKLRELEDKFPRESVIHLDSEYFNERHKIWEEYSGSPFIYRLFNELIDLNLAAAMYKQKRGNVYLIRVVDQNYSVFNYSEASSGLIQLFPIIADSVYAAIYRHDFISFIEQPELHLHPKLQAEIPGILLPHEDYEGYTELGGYARYIIETHSEQIVRGFQLKIARKEADPEMLKFYYFNQDESGNTKVIELKIDTIGNFITPWPNGFFDEASDLAMKLLEAQIRRN